MQAHPNEASLRYCTRAEAAEYIRSHYGIPCSKTTLQKYVTVGGGPRYQVFGRNAVYRVADLDEWVERKLSAPRMSSACSRVNA